MSKKNQQEKKEFSLKISPEIEQYERKIYDLKQLIEIGKGLNSTLDYNVLIDSILLTCMGQMQLFKAGIFTKKEIGNDNFVLHRNYKGFDLDHSIEYEIPADAPLIEFLEEKILCLELDEILNELGEVPSMKTLGIIKPGLIVPLIGKGKLNGIIILGERINQSEFSESEKEFLLALSSLAGIAIHNAYLYEMATTDMMTKLKIHHFFQTTLLEERERAKSSNGHLSIIMMDIDHFKDFNDTYGHTCGDVALINVARLIMEKVRQIDIAARYGGEEFSVVLPHTEIEEALVVAERIRESIEETSVECSGKELKLTISVGVAQYDPEKDNDNRELIERADKALYKSKQDGRNRISFLE